jgi:phosphatidate cytidylyltransferase
VTRVLSGAVLLVFAIVVVWLAPAPVFFAVAEALLLLGCHEFDGLTRTSGLRIPAVLSSVAAALTCASFARLDVGGFQGVSLDVVMLSALVAIGAAALPSWNGGRDAIANVSAAVLPMLYLGLPIGAMIAIRESRGGPALFLLMLTIIASDTAQYYSGRAFGRLKLAARISPKKTIEGAIGGFVFGSFVLTAVGNWWLPDVPLPLRVLLGLTIVALGIAGDLFESMLKRSAGVKDSSTLIPGHGGILDRIDALLFAAPVYYIVLKYV